MQTVSSVSELHYYGLTSVEQTTETISFVKKIDSKCSLHRFPSYIKNAIADKAGFYFSLMA